MKKGSSCVSPEMRETIQALMAKGRSARQIAAAIGLSRQTVWRAVRLFELGPWLTAPGLVPTPTPPDFADRLRTMFQRQLAAHYGVSRSQIRRWIEREGLASVRAAATAAEPKKRCGRAAPPRLPTPHRPITQISRDMSAVGQAVDHLRRFGAVYRCNDRGGAVDKGGTHWRRGSAVLTDGEVIDRAKRLGFDPDGWRKLAA